MKRRWRARKTCRQDAAARAAMFTRIAGRYDFLNAVLSVGRDAAWRRALLAHLPVGWQPRTILDVCCGTGAVLQLLAVKFPTADLTGLDFSRGMLIEAERRAERYAYRQTLVHGDQSRLPFADGCFQLVTNVFGVRNGMNPAGSMAEMHRVLAPGGILAIVELTRPPRSLLGRLFSVYFARIAPRIAFCLGGDRAAYTYLPRSVGSYLSQEEMSRFVAATTGEAVSTVALFGPFVGLFLVRKTSGEGPFHARGDGRRGNREEVKRRRGKSPFRARGDGRNPVKSP